MLKRKRDAHSRLASQIVGSAIFSKLVKVIALKISKSKGSKKIHFNSIFAS